MTKSIKSTKFKSTRQTQSTRQTKRQHTRQQANKYDAQSLVECYVPAQLKQRIKTIAHLLHIPQSQVVIMLLTSDKHGISDRQYSILCTMYGHLMSMMNDIALLLHADYYDHVSNTELALDLKSIHQVFVHLYNYQHKIFDHKIGHHKPTFKNDLKATSFNPKLMKNK